MTKRINESISKSEALIAAWKKRKNYKGYDRTAGSQFNSWRAITNTQKGKDIGFPESWKSFDVFVSDVSGDWERGKIVRRLDTSKPHGPENSFWANKGEENSGKLVKLEFNGETKTLIEWASELGLNYQGIRQRYFRSKNLPANEILFGKKRKTKSTKEQTLIRRTNGMLGAYRLRDKKRGLYNDMTLKAMRELISKVCVYCGDFERIGLDRIDNKKGHSMDNVVPCCHSCNTARNDNFSHSEMFLIGDAIRKVKEARHEDK